LTNEELIAKLTLYPGDAQVFFSGPSYLGEIDEVYGADSEVIIHSAENLA
jgi:hypothetical protein